MIILKNTYISILLAGAVLFSPVLAIAADENEKHMGVFSELQNEAERFLRKIGMKDLAVVLFKYSAEGGSKHGQANYALSYIRGWDGQKQDFTQAAEWFQKSAKQGSTFSEVKLARLYYYGLGVEKDYSKSANYAKRAADKDSPEAQAFLAMLYLRGHGIEKNIANSFSFNLKSAEQGNSNGQLGLGWRYLKGIKVKKSEEKALHWLMLAYDQGNRRATNNATWIMATSFDARLRDGEKAAQMLEDLIEKRKIKNRKVRSATYDSLAAAYAEMGRFGDAILMQEKAFKAEKEFLQKNRSTDTTHIKLFGKHLASYRQNRPWRK